MAHAGMARRSACWWTGRRKQATAAFLVVATVASLLVASKASPAQAATAPSRPLGLSTVAGSGQKGTVDGTGAAASFHSPRDVAVHPDGSAAYVIDDGGDDDAYDGDDTTPDSIRRVDLATGEVTTLSQGGLLDEPNHLDVDAAGNVYVSDTGGRVLRIDPAGSQSVLTDQLLVSGAPLVLAPGDAFLYVVSKTPEYQLRKWYNIVHLYRLDLADGALTDLGRPGYCRSYRDWVGVNDLAVDPQGRPVMAYSDAHCDGLYFYQPALFRLDPATGWSRITNRFYREAVAFDAAGSLFALRQGLSQIHRYPVGSLDPARVYAESACADAELVAGCGEGFADATPDNWRGRMLDPLGIDVGPDGLVYVADTANHRLRVVRPPKVSRPARELMGDVPRTFGKGGDPVNTATGSFYDAWVDLDFPEEVFGLDWGRAYNSASTATGPLGVGWTTSASASVRVVGEFVVVTADDGRALRFSPRPGGGWVAPEGVAGELRGDADGSYSLALVDGEVWDFDTAGRLATRTDWAGQRVTLSRDASARVATATSSAGPSLSFAYDTTTGLLSAVTASDGRAVTYAYETTGTITLERVVRPDGSAERYVTDAPGRITEVRDAEERLTVANTYDAEGRVSAQTTPDGATVSFTYDLAEATTTIADHGAEETTSYLHDERGWLVGMTDAAGAEVARGFDAGGSGELASFTDRRGATATQGLTDTRQVEYRVDAAGRRAEFAYDGSGRLVAVRQVDPAGADVVTTYTYEGAERIPATVTGPGTAGDPGGVTTIVSEAGLVTRVVDPDGVTTDQAWDPATRRLNSTTVAPGTPEAATTTYGYTAEGWLATVTSPLGHVTAMGYDPAGRLTSVTDPEGARTRYEYHPAGQLHRQIDPAGHATTYRYNPAGHLSEVTDARGKITRYFYDAAGDLERMVEPDDDDPAGAVTVYTYGRLGRLERVVDPEGVATSYRYDAEGNLTATASADGREWARTYTADGKLATESHPETPAGAATRYAYDALGRLASLTDADGAVTAHRYDPAGRVVETTGPRPGQVERRSYTPAGRLATVTDAEGGVVRYGYDAAGRQRAVTTAEGTPEAATTTTSFDADGRVAATVSPSGLRTAVTYDAAGRERTRTQPDGGVVERSWTVRGELASERDAEGGEVSFTYDPAGNLATITDANGAVTAYGYDARSNRTSRTAADASAWRWRFDLADRLVAAVGPAERTTTYAYDAFGRLNAVTDPSGRVETRRYDGADRLVGQTWRHGSSTIAVDYRLDPAGRLVERTDAAGVTRFVRDEAGNAVVVDAPGSADDVSYAYDLAGRRRSLTHADGTTVAAAYDAHGRLASVDVPGLGTTTYAYDADGRLVVEDLPGAANERRHDFDPATGARTRYLERLDGATLDVAVGYDRNGRLVREAVAGGATTTYAYDPAGQLTAATSGTTTLGYAYDAVGRRTRSVDQNGDHTYTYNAAGELESSSRSLTGLSLLGGTGKVTTTYTHDAAGRRTGSSQGTTQAAWTYNARGQLATAATTSLLGGTDSLAYSYDGAGRLRRLERAGSAAGITELAWDEASGEVIEMGAPGSRAQLAYGASRLGARMPGGTAVVFSKDHLGSTRRTPATTELTRAETFDPWGIAASALLSPPGEIGFGYRDELHVDGLVHLRARDYDPVVGAFTSRDPLDGVDGTPTVANPYHYADNDPLSKVDPTGLRPRDRDLRGGLNPRSIGPIGPGGRRGCTAAAMRPGITLAGVAGVATIGAPTVRCDVAASTGTVTEPGPDTGVQGLPRTPRGAGAGAAALAAALAAIAALAAAMWVASTPSESPTGEEECRAPQTNPACGDRAAVDANALIQAIDFGNPAVDIALRGRHPVAPPRAAQEYLVRGSQAALTAWLTARGGRIGSPAAPARAVALQAEAQSMGRALGDRDAEIAASAIQDGLPLLTRDEQLFRFMDAAGYAVERW